MRIAILSLSALTFSFLTQVHADEAAVNDAVANRMVGEAVAAGASGDLELRSDLLQRALYVSPDCAPARWASGQLQVDGAWQTVSNVQQEASNDELVQEYRSRKREARTPAQHLELARWCRKNELEDEARYHWLAVLTADGNNREALDALGATWFRGHLVTPDQAEQLKTTATKNRKRAERWTARIAGWKRALKLGGDQAKIALAELEAEVDESAIQTFEKLAAGLHKSTKAEQGREQELCRRFLLAMGRLTSYDSCVTLVRFSVLADQQDLRVLAADQLRDRPKHQYIPLLLDGLMPELEGRFAVTVTSTGRVQYDHEVFAEGRNGDEVTEIYRTGGTVLIPAWNRGISGEGPLMERRFHFGFEEAWKDSYQTYQEYLSDAARTQNSLARTNAQREALNSRIYVALEIATGLTLKRTPQAWWDEWSEHNGYEDRSSMPTNNERYYDSTLKYDIAVSQHDHYYRPPPPPSAIRRSCFVAGTPVWTKTGLQAIETLTPGDLVLTMDPTSGELCFRPVVVATTRAPSPTIEFTAGGEQIVSTIGHPFWVEGRGWRMARELAAGDLIRSATGSPVEVSKIKKTGLEEETFNLIVEGNSNYHVGAGGLLCHDNTPRNPQLVQRTSE